MPQHSLNIYQKPKAGNTCLKRLPIYNYSHTIKAQGWFDSAQGNVRLRTKYQALMFLEQFIGNRVSIIVDNPVEPIWEGLINRMTFNAGDTTYTISLDEMMNRVVVQYVANVAGTDTSTVTTTADSTASEAIYGIKRGQIEFGYSRNSASTAMNTLRDSLIANRAYPKSSLAEGGNGFTVHLELIGFCHTLEWDNYVSGATSAAVAISTFMTGTLLPGLANGATFFDNTDFKAIATNTVTFPQTQNQGGTYWDLLQQMAEVGDASGNGYIVGIEPSCFNRRDANGVPKRRFYYRAIDKTITYTVRMSKGLRVCNVYGKPIAPWRVIPDNGARIADWLPGYDLPGDDPRFFYVYEVDYDGDTQAIRLNSEDDTTLQGVFDLKSAYKRYGKKFGARIRYNQT